MGNPINWLTKFTSQKLAVGIFVAPWLMQKTIGTFSANEARAFLGLNKFARVYFGFSVSPCGIFFSVS